jgi:hypothetical protein
VQDRIDAFMGQRHREAHERVLVELDGERYLRLLDDLDELAARPPFLPKAGRAASHVLPRLVRRTWRRLDERMAAAQQAPRGEAQDELLHEVRKDAKRSRYAAEAVQPVFGKPAAQYAAAVTELQESLGDFQDGVVTREVLLELGALGRPCRPQRLHLRSTARARAGQGRGRRRGLAAGSRGDVAPAAAAVARAVAAGRQEHRPGARRTHHPQAAREHDKRWSGFRQTETWLPLSLVNGLPLQSATAPPGPGRRAGPSGRTRRATRTGTWSGSSDR